MNCQFNDDFELPRVLDDIEMYEEQKPFTLNDFCAMSCFLNHFVFKAIWNGYAGNFSIELNDAYSLDNYNVFQMRLPSNAWDLQRITICSMLLTLC